MFFPNGVSKKFSILVPTRNRPKQLTKFLESVERCSNPADIEVLICKDRDDRFLTDIDKYRFHIAVFFIEQNDNLIDYYNYLFSKSIGRVIWPLHDDCLVMTSDWDKIASENIGDDWDKVWLGDVVDVVAEVGKYRYSYDSQGGRISTMPMLPRKAVETLGRVFPKDFRHWGASNMLYKLHQIAKTIKPINICVFHDPVKDENYDRIRKWWLQDTQGKVSVINMKKEIELLRSSVVNNN